MKKEAWHDTWSQIDQTEDPGFFVRFLDGTRLAAVRAAHIDPAKYFAHLNVQPGQSILEVGCGTGDLLVPLSELAGPTGRAVGVDKSRTMIDEARRRAAKAGANVEFLVGDIQRDIHALTFPSNTFHHTLAVSVWQHLDEPGIALSEMVRLTRADGRVTITETDWDTQIIDTSDLALTRKIVHFFTDSLANGAIARELPSRMRDTGLEGISVTGLTSTATSLSDPEAAWLPETARRAAVGGVISYEEAEQWIADLAARSRDRQFFSAFTSFRVSGRKIASSPENGVPGIKAVSRASAKAII